MAARGRPNFPSPRFRLIFRTRSIHSAKERRTATFLVRVEVSQGLPSTRQHGDTEPLSFGGITKY